MECLRASMAVGVVWCGSAGNNSKVGRCWNDRDVSKVGVMIGWYLVCGGIGGIGGELRKRLHVLYPNVNR